MEKKEIEKMLYDLFRLCDSTVNIEDWVEFENKFSKITKKYGIDLHKIYYGKSYAEMKKTYARYDDLKSGKKNTAIKFKKYKRRIRDVNGELI